MKAINGENITYSYGSEGSKNRALCRASIEVKQGEFVAILGQNGCGKSTLAKHFNALLRLQEGELTVAGIDARSEAKIWKLRRKVGMVFQNPDNQFVSSMVEEDVAFGLENYQVPREEISERVRQALLAVGMAGYEKRAPHMLSGGQKQRIALAGVLALDPDILIFDEVTAMLDPEGRGEVLSMIRKLHDEQKKTIVMITHYIEESVFADRVFLMKDGEMVGDGKPRAILSDVELLQSVGLMPPETVRVYCDLKDRGIVLPYCPLTMRELADELSNFRKAQQ